MKKIIAFAFTCCLGLSAGCNKFLDTVPDNRVEINTRSNLIALIASAYPKTNYGALLNPRVDYVSDLGDGTEHRVNSDSFYWMDVEATDQDSPEYMWGKYYHSIASVNYAFRAIEEEGFRDVDVYIAEGKLIRAFSHFNLVNLFARFWEYGGANSSPGIPYVTEPETEVVKQYDRGTVASTYAAIEKDLKEGLAGVGPDDSYKAPSYHFTAKAANAFAVRFYLYQGRWQEVINHANTIFPVPVKFVDVVANGNLLDHNGEVIESGVLLSRNVDATDQANLYADENFQPWKNTYAGMSSSSEIKQLWSGDKSNLLVCEGVSRLQRYANQWRYATGFSDIEFTVNSATATGGKWNYKTYRDNATQTHWYVPKFTDIFIYSSIDATTGHNWTAFTYLRNEEVILSRAEALAMLGRYDEAIDDLNVFCRQRIWSSSNDKIYDESRYVVNKQKLINFYGEQVSGEDHYMNRYKAFGLDGAPLLKKCLLQFILDCRRNELMWEGLRYWDIQRYRIPVTHTTIDGQIMQLLPGDDRWMIQMPEAVVLSGIELNPRTNLLTPKYDNSK